MNFVQNVFMEPPLRKAKDLITTALNPNDLCLTLYQI